MSAAWRRIFAAHNWTSGSFPRRSGSWLCGDQSQPHGKNWVTSSPLRDNSHLPRVWGDGLEPPSEHHISLLMVVRLASLVHGREAPHLPYQPQHGGIYSCGNVACRMCRERNSHPVISSRPLHTMPTVGNTPRCSRLSPSAEEPMVRTLNKITR